MNYKTKIAKLLLFLPSVLIMIMIFNFSSEDSSQSTSTSQSFTKSIVSLFDTGFNMGMSDLEEENAVNNIEHLIRKLAHFSEYMLLGFSIVIPLYLLQVNGAGMVLGTEVFCFLYACSDEVHQLFIDGRSASLKDVIIDSFGALTAIAIVLIIIFTRKKINSNCRKKSVSSL